MNEKVYQTLEYNKIIDKLEAHAFSTEAKKRCRELIPMTDRAAIEEAQTYTKDALARILKKRFSLRDHGCKRLITKAAPGSIALGD